jgi:hypothetical protein
VSLDRVPLDLGDIDTGLDQRKSLTVLTISSLTITIG